MSEIQQKIRFHFEIFITFFKVGAFVFGGGFAMIPIIEREVVTKKHWVSEDEFIDLIAVTQSAPGPVAVNSAVFIGYKLSGLPGALVSLLGTVLPAFMVILIFAVFLASQHNNQTLAKFFAGVRPAVVALILGTGLKMGRKVIHSTFALTLSIAALGLLYFLHLHPIILIILGALAGMINYHFTKRHEGKEVS